MLRFLKRLLVRPTAATQVPSMPLELLRRGWVPHKFRDSNVAVILPARLAAGFDPEGVLLASADGEETHLSATLHREFDEDRAGALAFVSHLARKNGRPVEDRGTYRYYFDPTNHDPAATGLRFWVIGIPGSVVVVSILCHGLTPVSDALDDVRREIPHIVGEVL